MAELQNLGSATIGPPTVLPQMSASPAKPVTLHYFDSEFDFTIPASAKTHDGFRAWAIGDDYPKRGRITFINGELIVDMSPENMELHGDLKSELGRVLLNLVREQRKGSLYLDGVLISSLKGGVSNEPDLLYLSKASRKSGQVELTKSKTAREGHVEIVGPVDWVTEIVSPNSKRKDKKLLREAYYQAEIPEYWIVDVTSGEIEFEILRAGQKEYEAVSSEDGWLTSSTFGKSFRLTRELDEDDFWLYTLEVKE